VNFGTDFDALIARFSPDPTQPIALAVSGGSDSLALLFLTDEWAQRSGRQLRVYTVDHGFRAGAAAEADSVAALSLRLGHTHQTLKWTAPKRTQSAARAARFKLMCKAMSESGGACLLVGHTLDDVVETAIIRRRRGIRDASIAGPTLTSPAPVWPEGRGIAILRPLVYSTRAELRDILTNENWAWIDDPSNESQAFERVRVRNFLTRHPILRDTGTRFVRELQSVRRVSDRILGQALAHIQIRPDGAIDTCDAPISTRLLSILARCASGTAADPRASAVSDLINRLNTPGTRQTLGGAWFQRTAAGFLIGRDPGQLAEIGSMQIFDGRFERSPNTELPKTRNQEFLVRQSSAPDQNWREIISSRIAHTALCYQTPDLEPFSDSGL